MESTYTIPFPEQAIKEILPSYSHEEMLLFLKEDVVDRSMGCLFGSFIGDALGSYLQFAKEKDYDKLMSEVMLMPGGGVFKLRPGQITDDSQLAFHLLHALTHFDPKGDFQGSMNNLIITIANEYLNWFESKPFDIGITCRKGLAQIKQLFQDYKLDRRTKQFNLSPGIASDIATLIQRCVEPVSKDSQSNGSLMRIAPIPFYFGLVNKPQGSGVFNKQMGLTKDVMSKFMRKETAILHPNVALQNVCQIWSKMLIAIIKRRDNEVLSNIYEGAKRRLQSQDIGWGPFLSNTEPISANKEHIGWSKIAVTLGFEVFNITKDLSKFRSEQTYNFYIRYVLSRGGDTDTNAAIVGGLLGALVGFKKLPKLYLQRMMAVRFDSKAGLFRDNRPKFYQPRAAFINAFQFIRGLYGK